MSFVNQAEIPFPLGSGQPKFSAVHLSNSVPTVVVVVALPTTVVVGVVATSATVVVVITSAILVVVIVAD